MDIVSARMTEGDSAVVLLLADGAVATVPWPCTSWHGAEIQAWVDGGGVIEPYTVPPVDLVDYAAGVRWQVETGGVVIGGAGIDTSRESQAMITGAHAYALANASATISYKAAGGFVTLDAPTMIAVATAVGQHVQACFAREAAVVAAIAAGDVTETAEINAAFVDVAAPWPA